MRTFLSSTRLDEENEADANVTRQSKFVCRFTPKHVSSFSYVAAYAVPFLHTCNYLVKCTHAEAADAPLSLPLLNLIDHHLDFLNK